MSQKILLICKASINEGLGHFIRSITLADYLSKKCPDWTIDFLLISDLDLQHKLEAYNFEVRIQESLTDNSLRSRYDKIILDLLSLSNTEFEYIENYTNKIISISPIFNQMSKCDMLITRTKYLSESYPPSLDIQAGFKYSIIRSDCFKIDSQIYKSNLDKPSFHVAISMGGTDPNNNTLKVLKSLNDLQTPCVFWVMLGEGYGHNYDALTNVINKNKRHEIILAKTNKSMWHIMSNCSLAILTGGITSYEAAYSCLPSINYFEDVNKSYLVKELEENGLCLPICNSTEEIIDNLVDILENKEHLINIHNRCQSAFNADPIENIVDLLLTNI